MYQKFLKSYLTTVTNHFVFILLSYFAANPGRKARGLPVLPTGAQSFPTHHQLAARSALQLQANTFTSTDSSHRRPSQSSLVPISNARSGQASAAGKTYPLAAYISQSRGTSSLHGGHAKLTDISGKTLPGQRHLELHTLPGVQWKDNVNPLAFSTLSSSSHKPVGIDKNFRSSSESLSESLTSSGSSRMSSPSRHYSEYYKKKLWLNILRFALKANRI